MRDFYKKNAFEYFNSTAKIDPTSFLSPLIQYLSPKSTILDVGCGSGRDLRWLKEHGFKPTGFERSPTLAKMAREFSGCPVIEGDFKNFDFSKFNFNAIIMVGALVHVDKPHFPQVFSNICRALSPEGLVYITLKEGKENRKAPDGRIFVLWEHKNLQEIFSKVGFRILDFSRSVSKLRPTDIWLGYLLQMSK